MAISPQNRAAAGMVPDNGIRAGLPLALNSPAAGRSDRSEMDDLDGDPRYLQPPDPATTVNSSPMSPTMIPSPPPLEAFSLEGNSSAPRARPESRSSIDYRVLQSFLYCSYTTCSIVLKCLLRATILGEHVPASTSSASVQPNIESRVNCDGNRRDPDPNLDGDPRFLDPDPARMELLRRDPAIPRWELRDRLSFQHRIGFLLVVNEVLSDSFNQLSSPSPPLPTHSIKSDAHKPPLPFSHRQLLKNGRRLLPLRQVGEDCHRQPPRPRRFSHPRQPHLTHRLYHHQTPDPNQRHRHRHHPFNVPEQPEYYDRPAFDEMIEKVVVCRILEADTVTVMSLESEPDYSAFNVFGSLPPTSSSTALYEFIDHIISTASSATHSPPPPITTTTNTTKPHTSLSSPTRSSRTPPLTEMNLTSSLSPTMVFSAINRCSNLPHRKGTPLFSDSDMNLDLPCSILKSIAYRPEFREMMDCFCVADERSPRALHLTTEIIGLLQEFFVIFPTFMISNRLIECYLVFEEFFMVENVRKAKAIDEQQEESLMTSMVDDVFFVLQGSCVKGISIGDIQLMYVVRSGATCLLIYECRKALQMPCCSHHVLDAMSQQGFPSFQRAALAGSWWAFSTATSPWWAFPAGISPWWAFLTITTPRRAIPTITSS